jgi:hypothetical protein
MAGFGILKMHSLHPNMRNLNFDAGRDCASATVPNGTRSCWLYPVSLLARRKTRDAGLKPKPASLTDR